MLLGAPRPPRPTTRFSGWRIVALAAVALGMTGPGQTVGVSVFIDPMMAELGLTRSEVSAAYLVGTLAGAVALPRIGRFVDDRGTRTAMALIAGAFGVVLAAMGGVTGLATLVVGFTGIRLFGQGALGLVASNAVAPWFDRRRGLAMGTTTAAGATLISLLPLLAAFVIDRTGWRLAWLLLAVLVWSTVLPVALRGLIDRPEDVGQRADGRPDPDPANHDDSSRPAAVLAVTRSEALRTPMFWALAGAVAATGMIATGLGFHQIDLLGEQGLTPVQAAANFLPQTAAALGVTLATGALLDRIAPRWVILASMSLLVAAMLAVPHVQPGWSAALYGAMVGGAGAAARTVEAASLPALFGLRHLGAIRGVVAAIGVASTAFGPLALSLARDLTGSYLPALTGLLVLPIGVAVLGLFAPVPTVGRVDVEVRPHDRG